MNAPKTFPYTDEELDAAGLRGEGVSQLVIQTLETMREHPELLDLSLFTLECLNYPDRRKSSVSLASSASSYLSTVSTAVSPYVISDWERTMYYHGISLDYPDLLYRSDLLENPFPIPKGRFPHTPTKTVYGVFNTPLNAVWDTVAPQIRQLLKTRKIRYSAIKAARFVAHGEDDKDTIGPVVIWISTHPTTTTAENAYDASQDILALLEANGVESVVVEWYEGTVERLSGPHLLRVTDDIDPTHYVRRFLTAALGMPIATTEREAADAQGSVALFFHENKDKHGAPSPKVFGVTNCHVLREDTTVDYEFKSPGAPPQDVQLVGFHRFQRGLDEIRDCISNHGFDANILARCIAESEAESKSEDEEAAAEDKVALEAQRDKLDEVKKDIGILETFYNDVSNQWSDIARRSIGHVGWALKISVDVQGPSYTKDIATFEVDAVKFKAQFKGNVVDLGSKFTPWQLTKMFYPKSGGRTTFKWPTNCQLRINGCLTRELLAVPDCFDSNGEPCLIVMKDGNATDLTVGRYAGLEAYLCDDLGVESIELAIYNYNKQSGSFSDRGDSGSLIFDGEGHMVGIIHPGMPKGESNHVTYATPAWWAIEQLMVKYPHADFNRTTF
ncbi:hypothetical protein C0995_015686 [Termitomyces sp. Mi166|nr:hypothetical protein C0995_015686 [Termitomyces sp. Mi166\